MGGRRWGFAVVLVAAALLGALAPVPASTAAPAPAEGAGSAGELAEADAFTGTAGPREPGRFELAVLSTRPAAVTAGDALVGVRGLDGEDRYTVTRNGHDVTGAFRFERDGTLVGLVEGLRPGRNELTVTAVHPQHGARAATLPVTDHPVTGPVLSGPHQRPFHCETEDAGLGPPLDDDCSVEPQVRWFYLSTRTLDYEPLRRPFSPYPADTAWTTTSQGRRVPNVVRVETRTINRGITRIAVLDDPARRGPDGPYSPTKGWNDRVLYNFGASCGVGRHQGTNSFESVLSGLPDVGGSALDLGPELLKPAVAQGYLTAHSTLTTFGVHCNSILTAETLMMVLEHVAERYGRYEFAFGTGASGGAIQQYTTIDNYPGLLDGGIPLVSFPDVVTTAMSPADCRLLLRAFSREPARWNELKRTAVTGHLTTQICRDWDDLFAGHLVAASGCDGAVPEETVYHPVDNPGGVRCTLQDNLVTYMGTDPATGFARRPVDNVGVQYGLDALQEGRIGVDDFLHLNEQVGGFDIDGRIVPERHSMPDDLAADLYRWGAVVGRGAIDQAPIIDLNLWADAIPVLGFHDQVRAYMVSERIEERGGHGTHAIWSGVVLPNDAWATMDRWLTSLTAARREAGGVSPDGWADEVRAARPRNGRDRCVLTTAGLAGPLVLPLPAGAVDGLCELVFQPMRSPRMVAGGPVTEDVIKCQRRPPRRTDYEVTFTDRQWERLLRTFPDGVCDWTRPGVGEVDRSATWLSWGGDEGLDEPVRVPYHVALSTPVATELQATGDAVPARTSLPATGGRDRLPGAAALVVAGIVAVVLLRRRVPG